MYCVLLVLVIQDMDNLPVVNTSAPVSQRALFIRAISRGLRVVTGAGPAVSPQHRSDITSDDGISRLTADLGLSDQRLRIHKPKRLADAVTVT